MSLSWRNKKKPRQIGYHGNNNAFFYRHEILLAFIKNRTISLHDDRLREQSRHTNTEMILGMHAVGHWND